MKHYCSDCEKWFSDRKCNKDHFADDPACKNFYPTKCEVYDFKKGTVKRQPMYGKSKAYLERLAGEYHALSDRLLDEYRQIDYREPSREKVRLAGQFLLAARLSFDAVLALDWQKKEDELKKEFKEAFGK